tara:strand:+ start:11002 stop:12924 length:1923 start_codon:yes stop_codon:yes gene_type:complete
MINNYRIIPKFKIGDEVVLSLDGWEKVWTGRIIREPTFELHGTIIYTVDIHGISDTINQERDFERMNALLNRFRESGTNFVVIPEGYIEKIPSSGEEKSNLYGGKLYSSKKNKTKRRKKGGGIPFSTMKNTANKEETEQKKQFKKEMERLEYAIVRQQGIFKVFDRVYNNEVDIPKTVFKNHPNYTIDANLEHINKDEYQTLTNELKNINEWEEYQEQGGYYATIGNIINNKNPITILYVINIDVLNKLFYDYILNDQFTEDSLITILTDWIDDWITQIWQDEPPTHSNHACYHSPANHHHEFWTGELLEIPDYQEDYDENPGHWNADHHHAANTPFDPEEADEQGDFCDELRGVMGDIRLSLIISKKLIEANTDRFSELLNDFKAHARQVNTTKRDAAKETLNILIQQKRKLQDWQFQMIIKARSINNNRREEFPRPALKKINEALGTEKKGGKPKKKSIKLKKKKRGALHKGGVAPDKFYDLYKMIRSLILKGDNNLGNIKKYFETHPELTDEHIIKILDEIDRLMDNIKYEFSIRKIHKRIKFKKKDHKSKKDRLLSELSKLEKEISDDENLLNTLQDETNTKLQTGSDLKKIIEENYQGKTAKKVVEKTMVGEVVDNRPGFAYVKKNIEDMITGKD